MSERVHRLEIDMVNRRDGALPGASCENQKKIFTAKNDQRVLAIARSNFFFSSFSQQQGLDGTRKME